jgi:prepilin-type N-terminal cleavage/methylation domain-containing protein
MSQNITRRPRRRGFTLLELQVAVVLLAFGVATLASLMANQSRLVKRIENGFEPDGRIYLTQSNDPWVKKLQAPAQLSIEEPTYGAAPTETPIQEVEIVDRTNDLSSETITVTVDLTLLP